ncbi:unnamed protein product, partial [marine sediment metagenome]
MGTTGSFDFDINFFGIGTGIILLHRSQLTKTTFIFSDSSFFILISQ